MKCDKCKFKIKDLTGMDEYPAGTTITYCTKGHWDGIDDADQPEEGMSGEDYWEDCNDFKEKK